MQKLELFLEKYRIDIRTCLWALLASIIVMIAEFGSFTFVTDLYHNQLYNVFPNNAYATDARFFTELLFHAVFYSTYLPAIFLLLLVSSLIAAGFLLVVKMNFLRGKERILPILLLVFHPFLFVHCAYVENRLQTSGAILFAALAAYVFSGNRYRAPARIALSGILLSLSVLSFQPAIGIFLVSALFLHADAIIERSLALKNTIKQILGMALVIGLSLLIYEGCVFWARQLHIIRDIRVHDMLSSPAAMIDIYRHIKGLINLLQKVLIARTQFFPATVKWLLLANMVWLAVSVYRLGQGVFRKIWNVVFIVICFLSFYATIIFVYPIIPLPRIMPGLAFTWFFIFLFAMKYADRIGRSFAQISVIVCFLAFAIQFNIMHQRLTTQNEIDKQTTWQIINRIQPIAGPRNKVKVVALVGVMSPKKMPYWTKYSGVYEKTLYPDIIQSVYNYDFSKYRLIEFYYACHAPNKAQWQEAIKLVENSPLWPEEGCIVKGDGFIAVALSRP